MLVDVLCASLIKRRIPVTEAERDAVANVLGQFDPPVEGYRYLNDPQGVLSELHLPINPRDPIGAGCPSRPWRRRH
ncbi:hypothetical protein [Nocardia gipuzkoensis]|uniref:hypothetical protein n=1 Tax=Nocardia gipuzkoensis TaxID=2749991 RepID=UPI0015EE3BFD|nr:hypothetical protein [Nocardia gipuzkoensis]